MECETVVMDEKKKAQLKSLIDAAGLVSFDIFDTLLRQHIGSLLFLQSRPSSNTFRTSISLPRKFVNRKPAIPHSRYTPGTPQTDIPRYGLRPYRGMP